MQNNENQPPEVSNAETPRDKEVTLNHIDKAYDMFAKTSSLVNRLALTLIIASSLMLTVSIGWISAGEDFSLGGLGLKVSFAALLGGAIVLIASVYVAFYTAFIRILALQVEIRRLYKTIGYEEPSMHDWLTGFAGSDIVRLLMAPGGSGSAQNNWTKYFELSITMFVTLVLFALLPITTEIAMVAKLASVAGWDQYYVWLPFVVFAVIVTITIVLWLGGPRHKASSISIKKR